MTEDEQKVCYEKLLIENHILIKICNELFLKYSSHHKNCEIENQISHCTCGYHDLLGEFNSILK